MGEALRGNKLVIYEGANCEGSEQKFDKDKSYRVDSFRVKSLAIKEHVCVDLYSKKNFKGHIGKKCAGDSMKPIPELNSRVRSVRVQAHGSKAKATIFKAIEKRDVLNAHKVEIEQTTGRLLHCQSGNCHKMRRQEWRWLIVYPGWCVTLK